MKDDRLISILCAQQWQKCKGELNALIALQGSTLPKYEGNESITDVKWRTLQKFVDLFINEIESNDLDN